MRQLDLDRFRSPIMKLKLVCGITEKEAPEGVTKKTEER